MCILSYSAIHVLWLPCIMCPEGFAFARQEAKAVAALRELAFHRCELPTHAAEQLLYDYLLLTPMSATLHSGSTVK